MTDGVRCDVARKSEKLIALSQWKSSGTLIPRKKTKLIRSNSINNMPTLAEFSSNHIQINRERQRRGLTLLKRQAALDEAARKQAAEMAKMNKVRHSNPSNIILSVASFDNSIECRRIGENVMQGKSIRTIHAAMMVNCTTGKRNLLDPSFKNMGVGTCRGKNGKLFLCQIFEG
eukprot:CAMPEP_0118700400 /NCGR_PEP_ID=MMETSP0800-20121206/16554_1 /TAXON_ID=210618 ORGANISM="Striatella unipunctata, Strain CCMP2910" /NCGR_SAMPLE_ID=MMETSP0800 /ASSEMBLY_ACC=CAM_ASM_000638 /LENGTH=173 /DNA_ID=CAMNT_0006600965 /DNA_START=33 /DNA_END=554 /DNA_ORIENTATION=+